MSVLKGKQEKYFSMSSAKNFTQSAKREGTFRMKWTFFFIPVK